MAGEDRRRTTEGVVAPLGAERRLLSCLFLDALFGLASAATRRSSGCVRKVGVTTNDGENTMIPAARARNTVVVVANDSLVTENVLPLPVGFHGIRRQVGTRWADGTEGEYPGDTYSTFVDMFAVDLPPGQAEPFTSDDDYSLHDWWRKSTAEQTGLASMHMVLRSLLTNGRGCFTNCLAAPSLATASCNATYPEPAPLMGFLYLFNFQAQRPKGDGATRFNLSVTSASRVHGATRTDSSTQAAAPPPPAADNSSHHVATPLNTDHLFDHTQSSNNGLVAAVTTTTTTAVLIDLADKKKKRSGRGRGSPAAVAMGALVMLLTVAALLNPATAARPLYGSGGGGGGGGHHEAAAAPAVTMTVLNNAAAGHSGCTNDPNTLEPVRCVHH